MEIELSMSTDTKPWYKHVWIQRIVFLVLALACYPAMSYTIQLVSDVSGLTNYNTGGPGFILNDFTGPIVMTNFVFILFFIGLSMAFIFKAFGTSEEFPID